MSEQKGKQKKRFSHKIDPKQNKKKNRFKLQEIIHEIKAEFVTGTMTLKSLSEKYDVSYYALRQASTRGGWTSERERLAMVISESHVRDKLISKAEEREKFDNNCILMAKTLISVVANRLNDAKKKIVSMIYPFNSYLNIQ